MFGDSETGSSEPQLARYQRALTGGKAEYRGRNIAATAFVADTPYRFRRDEIQGNGLTGPYQLGAKDILPNSERITIETRDRLHSERIVDSISLTRHVRSEEPTSELQSLMRISYAVFCLKKKKQKHTKRITYRIQHET